MTLKSDFIAWSNSPAAAIVLLVIFYTVGIVGILLPLHEDFLLLTPFQLLLSLGLMLWHHPEWSRRTLLFLFAAYFLGFGAELFGVQTGLLFGDYSYGRVLGPKLWGTPLMIGVNWMLLAYAAGVSINHLAPRSHWLVKAILAGLLMVGLDVLIEPVAIKYAFWSWEGQYPPLQNYIGWFIVALPLLCLFSRTQGHIRNKVAIALLLLQLMFFLILGIA